MNRHLSCEKLRVFLVDDTPFIRALYRAHASAVNSVEIVGEADCVSTAIVGIPEAAPDVVLLDLRMADGTGVDVLRQLRGRLPRTNWVVVTCDASEEVRNWCLREGADKFVGKAAINSHFFAGLLRHAGDVPDERQTFDRGCRVDRRQNTGIHPLTKTSGSNRRTVEASHVALTHN